MAAPQAKLKQQLDSAYLLMGKKTAVAVELLSDKEPHGAIVVQSQKMPREVEIADQGTTDTVNLGNDRWQLRRTIIIQSFDSGFYSLPPVLYIEGGETIASSPLALKVIPVPVDTLTDIHDYAATADAGLRWYDRLPDWLVDYGAWILLALILIAAATFLGLKYLRRKANGPAVKTVRKEPPYEAAIRQLEHLRQENLCERGQEREFYTRLTEILRIYLQERFGINAMEMTSTEILSALSNNEETRMPKRYMTEILNMADFVKFAKVRPLPDDNVKTFRSAMQFVEDTRPLPPAEPSSSSSDSK